MQLHLALERLDRSFARRARSAPRPEPRRWSRRASLGRTRCVGKAPVDRLDALEPEQAGHFARDHRARADDAGRDRDRGDRHRAPCCARTPRRSTNRHRRRASRRRTRRGRRSPSGTTRLRRGAGCARPPVSARLGRHDAFGALRHDHAAAPARRAVAAPSAAHRPRSRAARCRDRADRDRSSQPVSEQKLEREVEIDMRNAVDRRRIDRRRLEHRHVEEGLAPGVRPRRPDRHVADEELRLLADSRPAARPRPARAGRRSPGCRRRWR